MGPVRCAVRCPGEISLLANRKVHFLDLRRPSREAIRVEDTVRLGRQILTDDNAGVLRWARWEQKSHVQQTLEQRVKAHLILIFRMNTNRESVAFQSAWVLSKRYQKSYYKYNWLVPAKRSHRFLILRCRLFLSLRSRIPQVMDCSPTNRELQLGFDRRETG